MAHGTPATPEEIEPFLRRLTEVTRTRAYVVVRFQQRELALLDLFERVWGEPRCFEPTFADLFGAACQIGIWPNVTRIPYVTNLRFDSFDDAVQTVRTDLLNPQTEGVEETIRAYLKEHMLEQVRQPGAAVHLERELRQRPGLRLGRVPGMHQRQPVRQRHGLRLGRVRPVGRPRPWPHSQSAPRLVRPASRGCHRHPDLADGEQVQGPDPRPQRHP